MNYSGQPHDNAHGPAPLDCLSLARFEPDIAHFFFDVISRGPEKQLTFLSTVLSVGIGKCPPGCSHPGGFQDILRQTRTPETARSIPGTS